MNYKFKCEKCGQHLEFEDVETNQIYFYECPYCNYQSKISVNNVIHPNKVINEVTCPHCKSIINKNATVCPFCKHTIFSHNSTLNGCLTIIISIIIFFILYNIYTAFINSEAKKLSKEYEQEAIEMTDKIMKQIKEKNY